MKKNILALASVVLLSISSFAQTATQGTFEKIQLKNAVLHVYNSNDVMADASFIVEGKDSLVIMETPLFKTNEAEFCKYVSDLKKPVAVQVTDYHEGAGHNTPILLAEGMGSFMKGAIYGGMMNSFKQGFGETMVELADTHKATEIPFGKTVTLAGVTFKFNHGASSDFPAASIIIDNTAYLTHWVPSEAHVSHLQVGNPGAIDAEIAETETELKSGCTVFVGGHGGKGTRQSVEFKKAYLDKAKQFLNKCKNAEEWAAAMKKAYPNLPLEDNLKALSEALYKK